MLTEKEVNYLKLIAEEESNFEDKLTEWEWNFIEDILEKFEDYDNLLCISLYQWEHIVKIGDKLGL